MESKKCMHGYDVDPVTREHIIPNKSRTYNITEHETGNTYIIEDSGPDNNTPNNMAIPIEEAAKAHQQKAISKEQQERWLDRRKLELEQEEADKKKKQFTVADLVRALDY